MNKPAKGDWNELFQATLEYQKIAPWDWMENEDLFAVEDPESGETGYCSILGSGKQEFGLVIFLGDKGFERYLEMFSSESGTDDFDENIMTPMLSLTFGSRRDMQKQDIEVIKSLGLEFRGKNAWPLLRSQRPGYAPWFLEKKEALFLTTAIEQALMVSQRIRNDGLDLYMEADKNAIFTRFCRDGKWQDEWRQPGVPDLDKSPGAEAVCEAELLLLRNSMDKLGGSWEMDIFILPVPIGAPNDRPSFPLCFLIVDRKEGLVINTMLTEPWFTLTQKRDTVIQILKKVGPLPNNILVKSQKVKEILTPITRHLGISLGLGRLLVLEEVKANLSEHFSR